MIKTFTQDDVVKYVYNETTQEQRQELEYAMLFDASVSEELSETLNLRDQLNEVLLEPSEKTIDKILKYSESFNLPA